MLLQPPPETQLRGLPGPERCFHVVPVSSQALRERGCVRYRLRGARGRVRTRDERRVPDEAGPAEGHARDGQVVYDLHEGLVRLRDEASERVRQNLPGDGLLAFHELLPHPPLRHGVVVGPAVSVREHLAQGVAPGDVPGRSSTIPS